MVEAPAFCSVKKNKQNRIYKLGLTMDGHNVKNLSKLSKGIALFAFNPACKMVSVYCNSSLLHCSSLPQERTQARSFLN